MFFPFVTCNLFRAANSRLSVLARRKGFMIIHSIKDLFYSTRSKYIFKNEKECNIRDADLCRYLSAKLIDV